MGLPLRNSLAEHLVLSFMQLIEKFKFDKSQNLLLSKIYFQDFISTPLLAFTHLQNNNTSDVIIGGNYLYLSSVASNYNKGMVDVIVNTAQSTSISASILQLIEYVLNHNLQIDFVNRALLQQLVLLINRTMKSLAHVQSSIVIKDILRTVKVPFDSDKNASIQLMGFLETRCLDFDELILLNLNEGVLPSDSTLKTYIPYTLRKAFKLPLEENNESISAYHFYRLLQRAKKVDLTFNTEVNSLGAGEPSRYIRQLEYDILQQCPSISYSKKVMAAPVPDMEQIQLAVTKTNDLIEKLRDMYCTHQVKFSPTALNMYIECKLKFYYRYILKIKEPQREETELSPMQIGNIIHLVMENAYKDKVILNSNLLSQVEEQLDTLLYAAYVKEYETKTIQNNNIVTYDVLQNIIQSIIAVDKARLPITLVALEKEFEEEFKINEKDTVLIKGIIDRVEKAEDHFLIVDYKTGKVELTDTLEKIFTDSKYKVAFQLLLYAAALKEPAVKVAAFPLKKVKEGLDYLFDGNMITESMMIEFKDRLARLLNEIINEPVDLKPTTSLGSCSYCDFKLLCRR
ncbi:MAG: PD-(D/E)XK nuclease family protein [Bacteroidetes bacterium]|nr:PD-(D/E)XK nuclease family protein [Bacteroidota bacterium]